jgi:hypothetical protein
MSAPLPLGLQIPSSSQPDPDTVDRLKLFQELIATPAKDPSDAKCRLLKYRNLCESHIKSLKERIHNLIDTSNPSTPTTTATRAGERLEFLYDSTTHPPTATNYDRITQDVALSLVRNYQQNCTVIQPLGCRVPRNAPSQKINLRNTLVDGVKLGVQIYLHQLVLISIGRKSELMATLNPDLDLEVSHLCHNGSCFNDIHLVVEPAVENKDRNTCQGNAIIKHKGMTYHPCRHGNGKAKRKCLLPVKELDDGYYVNN